MKINVFRIAVAAIVIAAPPTAAFTGRPSRIASTTPACSVQTVVPFVRRHVVAPKAVAREDSTALRSVNGDTDENAGGFLSDLQINPPFAAAYALFLLFAFVASASEAPGASQEILDRFLADPVRPGVNELFASVFNLLGLVGIPMACLMLPGSKGQKLPAAPFLVASAFAGYGGLGPYAMTRRATPSVSKSDLGWVTANVFENKLFNWFVVATALSTFFVTGCAQALLANPAETIGGYRDLFSNTAIASASSVDLAILTLTAASLIPEDLERRGFNDKGASVAIAASTLLLPVVGSTIYCALRPSLPDE